MAATLYTFLKDPEKSDSRAVSNDSRYVVPTLAASVCRLGIWENTNYQAAPWTHESETQGAGPAAVSQGTPNSNRGSDLVSGVYLESWGAQTPALPPQGSLSPGGCDNTSNV